MKKVFFVFVCAAAVVTAKAQVKFGVKAGVNIASETGDISGIKSKPGFNAGVYAKIPLVAAFSLNPEVYFSGQGFKAKDGSITEKVNTDYVNIPVLVQYNHSCGFFAQTGPQLGILLSAKYKVEDVKEDIKSAYKTTDFAWAFGAGYITKLGIGINARYNLGLGNINDASSAKVHNSVFQAGLLFQLGGR